MGLLDGMLGDVVGSVLGGGGAGRAQSPLGGLLDGLGGGNQAQCSTLLRVAMSMIQQHGGLGNVLDMFRRSGLGEQADSWVGTGPNMGISPDQVRQVFGDGSLGSIASQLGMSHGEASSVMAQILPELINHITPQGRIPDDHQDVFSKALAALCGGGTA